MKNQVWLSLFVLFALLGALAHVLLGDTFLMQQVLVNGLTIQMLIGLLTILFFLFVWKNLMKMMQMQ